MSILVPEGSGRSFGTILDRVTAVARTQRNSGMVMVRGIEFQGNLDIIMGLEFYNHVASL